jgi:hypothetical protein
MEELTADYLVVGAGAMGMAFVDSLVTESDKTVVMVDRYARPGGHWTTAYPFVRLHQVAAAYGVNSRILERPGIEEFGWNKGLPDCSSRDEILAYYDNVMDGFLRSKRVQYFPKCEYDGEGGFHSIVTNKKYHLGKDTIIVDATYSQTMVPSMRPPPFEVADGIEILPINSLSAITRPYENYTVVGGGKTSMDACLWLLANGVEPSRITWIRPRDTYLLERDRLQIHPDFAARIMGYVDSINASIVQASSIEDLVKRLAESEALMQFDKDVKPTMYHCPTVSRLEFEALKGVKNVVRKGRVTRITPEEVTLTEGSYKPVPDTLYIDCAACAAPQRPAVPVFQDRKITLQFLRVCQQTFSAALAGHLEAAYDDDELKNKLSRPAPMLDKPEDFAWVSLEQDLSAIEWLKQPKTVAWLGRSRLDLYRFVMRPGLEEPEKLDAHIKALSAGLSMLCNKLQKLVNESPEVVPKL